MHGEVGLSGTRNDFDPIDLGGISVGRESDVELAVRDVRVYGFDAGALAPPALA